jgi:hypothetical protein
MQVKVQYQFKAGAVNNDIIRAMHSIYFQPATLESGNLDVTVEVSEQKQRMMSNFDFLN